MVKLWDKAKLCFFIQCLVTVLPAFCEKMKTTGCFNVSLYVTHRQKQPSCFSKHSKCHLKKCGEKYHVNLS